MPDTIEKALTPDMRRSVQSHPKVGVDADAVGGAADLLFSTVLQVWGSMPCVPGYYSNAQRRDKWLREFVKLPGNDLLVGTVATIVSKVATTGWAIEGPERTANLYRKILLQQSDFGAGWTTFIEKIAWDYLTQDKGGFIERIRSGRKGAALGFAPIDSARCMLTGDPRKPVVYEDRSGEPHNLDLSQVVHIVDSPSPMERLNNRGFCAVSRAWTTARILMDIAVYERERLSDLPPAGLLTINNLTRQQWEDIGETYETRQQQKGNNVWRNIMVAFGLDPAIPVDAKIISFSNLPEHFNKRDATEIAIYSFALAFREDPRELWPVSTGTMGTATEANIQHMKARAKGTGMVLTEIERGFNDGLSLPPSLTFRFDFQDTEEDQQAAEIANLKADYITKLWKPDAAMGMGIISTEEARQWLVRQGLFDEEDLQTMDDEGVATDVETAKAWGAVDMGPRVRAYSDGRTVQLERRLFPVAKAGEGIVAVASENLRRGLITPEAAAEWALGELIERGGV